MTANPTMTAWSCWLFGAAMLECVGQPDVLDGEPEQVRAIVRRAFPVMYVLHGQLTFDRKA